MTHMTAVKDKQTNGAWLRLSDGKHVGYVHDVQDALAIVHAYNAMHATKKVDAA